MEKIEVTLRPVKTVKFDFQDYEIIIDPHINLVNQIALMRDYLEVISDEGEPIVSRCANAEYGFILGVVDYNTNIKLSKVSDEGVEVSTVSIDDIIGSGLWYKIENSIENLDYIRKEIVKIVAYNRESDALEKSIGYNFDYLVNVVTNFIGKISELDLSKEGIAELFQVLQKAQDEYNTIVDPSKVEKKPSTKRKTK